MMFLYPNPKAKFQAKLRPLARFLAQKKIAPAAIVTAGMGFSFLTGLLILFVGRNALLLLPLALVIRLLIRVTDELLVTEFNMKSNLGLMLIELERLVSDCFLYLPLARLRGFPDLWVVMIVVSGMIAEMVGVIGVQMGAGRRVDGPMGNGPRALIFGILGILFGAGLRPGIWLGGVFVIVVILQIFTIVNRVSRVLKQVGA